MARNDKFQNFARQLSKLAGQTSSDSLCSQTRSSGLSLSILLNQQTNDPVSGTDALMPVNEALLALSSNVGENLKLSRGVRVTSTSGIIGSYVHNQVSENMGSIGAIVALDTAVSCHLHGISISF